MTQGSPNPPTWRDFERLERDLKDLAVELRNQKTMSRDDIVDRLTLISGHFKESLDAIQKQADNKDAANTKVIASLRSLVERVIFAVIGALAAGVLSLLIEIIKLLAPKAIDGT